MEWHLASLATEYTIVPMIWLADELSLMELSCHCHHVVGAAYQRYLSAVLVSTASVGRVDVIRAYVQRAEPDCAKVV
jgi:hypothetical protein